MAVPFDWKIRQKTYNLIKVKLKLYCFFFFQHSSWPYSHLILIHSLKNGKQFLKTERMVLKANMIDLKP